MWEQHGIIKSQSLHCRKLEDDTAWQVLQKPAKLKKYVSPEKLEEFMEETIWQEKQR